jgi:hypothetical protein
MFDRTLKYAVALSVFRNICIAQLPRSAQLACHNKYIKACESFLHLHQLIAKTPPLDCQDLKKRKCATPSMYSLLIIEQYVLSRLLDPLSERHHNPNGVDIRGSTFTMRDQHNGMFLNSLLRPPAFPSRHACRHYLTGDTKLSPQASSRLPLLPFL